VALTWAGRVSFVLTEALTLKKIKLLDVVLQGQGSPTGGQDGGFDADVALMTGELSLLLPELLEALGGPLVKEAGTPGGAVPEAAPADSGAPPWKVIPA
jgi:recombination associated protein RdgC